MEAFERARRWLTPAMVATALVIAACGGEGRTTTGGPAAADEAGTPIRIQTHVAFLRHPTAKAQTKGEVLPGSTLGGSPFCVGGSFRDGHGEPPLGLVVKTMRCPGGRLTITFSPTQRSLKQSGDWRIVRGSGRFAGLSGGGQMSAVFESKGGEGTETFTGTVTR